MRVATELLWLLRSNYTINVRGGYIVSRLKPWLFVLAAFFCMAAPAFAMTIVPYQTETPDGSLAANAAPLGTSPNPHAVWNVRVEGNHAYVHVDDSLVVLDVSDPAHPFPLDSVPLPDAARGIDIRAGYAYVSGYTGVTIVDISNPDDLVVVGHYDRQLDEVALQFYGDHAYLLWMRVISYRPIYRVESGLDILDVSNPSAPVLVDHIESPLGEHESAEFLFVVDHYLYARHQIFDISTPTSPVPVAEYTLPRLVHAAQVSGTHAYITADEGKCRPECDGRLLVFDVTTPTAPVEMAQVSLGGTVHLASWVDGFDVSGTHIYVPGLNAENQAALQIVDVSNPSAPSIVGEYPAVFGNISVSGSYAYIADTNLGESGALHIVDVSNPSQPTLAGLYQPYAITGRVADVNGTPFGGVTLDVGRGFTTTVDSSGRYTFTGAISGTHTITPSLEGYAFWPPTRTVTLPPDAAGQDFIIVAPPAFTTLEPGAAGYLAYTDTQGLATWLDFPTNAVSQTTAVAITPTVEARVPNFRFTGHAFELAASRSGVAVPDFTFGAPVTLTIQYSDVDIHALTDESELELWWWNGGGWQDAAETCAPLTGYSRDVEGNRIAIGICRTGRFALFGPTLEVYLPSMHR
jgi:hypothetical protein